MDEKHFTPNELTIYRAAVQEIVANTTTTHEMVGSLSAKGWTVTPPDGKSVEAWSRPMTKKQIAAALGCPAANKVRWLNQCVADGTLRIEKFTRQSWRVDLTSVPTDLRAKFSRP